MMLRDIIPLLGRTGEPTGRIAHILPNAQAISIHHGEFSLSDDVTSVRGPADPLNSFGEVLWDASSIPIDDTKGQLRIAIILVGSQPKPFYGFKVIPGHATAREIHVPYSPLGDGTTLFGQRTKKPPGN
jgi:hypothetical protein